MEFISGFLNGILSFIIKFFFWIIGLIASLVIYPIQAVLVTAFPSLGQYLVDILNFFHSSIFPMISFCRECFLSVTCLPRPLFTATIGIFVFRYTIIPVIRSIVAFVNVYYVARGSDVWYRIH